eukprot:6213213-Pleurochrysis_carterae.AAC.1
MLAQVRTGAHRMHVHSYTCVCTCTQACVSADAKKPAKACKPYMLALLQIPLTLFSSLFLPFSRALPLPLPVAFAFAHALRREHRGNCADVCEHARSCAQTC